MEFEVHYFNADGTWSHTYTQRWVRTHLFCPSCGKGSVWREDAGGGDYYVGESHRCTACGHGFTIQVAESPPTDPTDPTDAQILAHLRGQEFKK